MPALIRLEPFSIEVDDQALDDLLVRIRSTRWPEPAPDAAWRQGTDLGYLQSLLADWADGFDWRAGWRHRDPWSAWTDYSRGRAGTHDRPTIIAIADTGA